MVPHAEALTYLPRGKQEGRSTRVDLIDTETRSASRRTLYVVATPIGNLGDITLRAIEVLRTVRLVVAEDTRRTGRLLAHLGIKAPLLSFHEHNRVARIPRVLDALTDGDVAIVTDAGTPSVSDPGQDVVAEARRAGFAVVAVPGASALAASLMVAGIAADFCHFLGFLPRKPNDRRRILAMAATWPGAVVFFEAPHRLAASLTDVFMVFGNRQASVCNDLTKRFEHVWHAPLSEIVERFHTEAPRGEFTVVVAAATAEVRIDDAKALPDAGAVRARFAALLTETDDRREAMRRLSEETGQSKKAIYALVVGGRESAGLER